MSAKTFKFIVPDLKEEIIPVRVPVHSLDCTETIIESAAMVLFYGAGGWQEAWPLTFYLYTENGTPIATAEVFIISAEPHFDVIIVKPDRVKMQNAYNSFLE